MAKLIRPELTHIGIYRDHSTCGLAILPFRVQNAEGTHQVGPMDLKIDALLNREPAISFFICDELSAHNTICLDH